MILATPEQVKEYTEKGYWGTKTLIDYFKEHVAEMPERIAVVDPLNKEELVGTPCEKLTYKKLDQATDAVATALLEIGVEKDDIIMVQLPNCWELAMLYLSITRAGALISPAPMQWRARELGYIAELTQAKAFITVEDFKGFKHKEMVLEIKSRIPSLKHVLTYDEVRKFSRGKIDADRLNSIKIDANDIFTLCWTSGTEAEPKGCPLSHNNRIYNCSYSAAAAGIQPGDVQITAGPLVNTAAVGTTFVPWLVLGGTFVLHHPFDPMLFIKQIMGEKVNYTLIVPAVANIIVKHPQVDEFDLGSLRTITMGSAPLSLYTIKEFKRRWNIEVGNIWGQNEGTGLVSSFKDVPEMELRVNSLPQFGKPGVKWSVNTEGIFTKLVDPSTGQEVTGAGAVGELAYKSPGIISGYFSRPDLTAKAFDEDGYFYTGDLFQIKEKNYISFFERKKDIIIRGGYNISAQEIENALLAHPKVTDVAAVGMPDEVLGERTCVCVVPRAGENITLDEVTTFMKEQGFAVYKLPERLEILEAIPRNPVGKILKANLRDDIKRKIRPKSV